jgi:hypothetical protein
MQEIQHKIRTAGIKSTRQVALCKMPKCQTCCENKSKKRSHKRHQGSITAKDEYPGSGTSIDHVDAAKVPGNTWQCSRQPTLNKFKKFKNFMIFVDHKTELVYLSFQETKSGAEACRSKWDHETFAKRYNFDIDKYYTDNGAYCTEIFQKEIQAKGQNISFSGVNAQWQNGLVECDNGTLCAAARSMLNHAISKWGKIITPELWTYTIKHAATIFNNTRIITRDYEEIPWEKITGERPKLHQHDMHPLFAPSIS